MTTTDARRAKLALSMLFLAPGSPALLCGDEVPTNKRRLKEWPARLTDFTVSRLARLKRKVEAFGLVGLASY